MNVHTMNSVPCDIKYWVQKCIDFHKKNGIRLKMMKVHYQSSPIVYQLFKLNLEFSIASGSYVSNQAKTVLTITL